MHIHPHNTHTQTHMRLVVMCARALWLRRVSCNYSSEQGAVFCMADGPAPCCIRYPWQPPPSSQLTAPSWPFRVTKCHYCLCWDRQSRNRGLQEWRGNREVIVGVERWICNCGGEWKTIKQFFSLNIKLIKFTKTKDRYCCSYSWWENT